MAKNKVASVRVLKVTPQKLWRDFEEAKSSMSMLLHDMVTLLCHAAYVATLPSDSPRRQSPEAIEQLERLLDELDKSLRRANLAVFLPGRYETPIGHSWEPLSPYGLMRVVGVSPPVPIKGAICTSVAIIHMAECVLQIADRMRGRVLEKLTDPANWQSAQWGTVPSLADADTRNLFHSAFGREFVQIEQAINNTVPRPQEPKISGIKSLSATDPGKWRIYQRIHALYGATGGSRTGRRSRFLETLHSPEHHDLRELIAAAKLTLDLDLIDKAIKCVNAQPVNRD